MCFGAIFFSKWIQRKLGNKPDDIKAHENKILISRKRAHQGQVKQAESMVKRSKRIFPDAKVGDTVTVPIPSVDRGRCDPRNLIGVVKEKESNGHYTIVVKNGILQNKYTRNQFDVCGQALYSLSDFNNDQLISLRKAVRFESKSGGQGFVKCNCS